MHDHQPAAESKSRASQTKEHQSLKHKEPIEAPALQRDLLSQINSLPSAKAYAALLNHSAGKALEGQHSVLQLQQRYGNRYVQRVVDIARQGEGNADVSPEVEAAIQRKRGSGQALDSRVQTQMESAFGTDFGGVRVHTDGEADGLNRALSARAFTTGQDIFFRQGEYAPGSSSGKELLAHELTHVVQQSGGLQRKLMVNQPVDRYEQEADRVARLVVQQSQSSTALETSERRLDRDVMNNLQRKCAACQLQIENVEVTTLQPMHRKFFIQRQPDLAIVPRVIAWS